MILFALFCLSAFAQDLPQCTKANTAFCASAQSGVTDSNIIFRCSNATGQAQSGNCNDNLAGAPPVGVKLGAYCWQSSPTAGDAQCTFNCVSVTAANGTTFYPLGCNNGTSSSQTTPGLPSPVSSSTPPSSAVLSNISASESTSISSTSEAASSSSTSVSATMSSTSASQPAQSTFSGEGNQVGIANLWANVLVAVGVLLI